MSEPLSEAQRVRLAGQLREKLRQDCDESESIGYPPRQFRIMLAENGPVGACDFGRGDRVAALVTVHRR
jgi:hypothetical protein